MKADITEIHGHLAVIAVAGYLNHATGWHLRNVIAQRLSSDLTLLILDLTALKACDEAGLHVLTGAAASLGVIGGSLRLAAAPEDIRTLPGLTRHGTLLPLHDDVDTAVTAARAAESNGAS